MMMGPEPMIRIFLRSVRLGIFSLYRGGGRDKYPGPAPMFLFLTRNPQGAPTGAVMRVYFDLQAGAGEVSRQGERLREVSSIVFFCADQGQQIFALADCHHRRDLHPGEVGRLHAGLPPEGVPLPMTISGDLRPHGTKVPDPPVGPGCPGAGWTGAGI